MANIPKTSLEQDETQTMTSMESTISLDEEEEGNDLTPEDKKEKENRKKFKENNDEIAKKKNEEQETLQALRRRHEYVAIHGPTAFTRVDIGEDRENASLQGQDPNREIAKQGLWKTPHDWLFEITDKGLKIKSSPATMGEFSEMCGEMLDFWKEEMGGVSNVELDWADKNDITIEKIEAFMKEAEKRGITVELGPTVKAFLASYQENRTFNQKFEDIFTRDRNERDKDPADKTKWDKIKDRFAFNPDKRSAYVAKTVDDRGQVSNTADRLISEDARLKRLAYVNNMVAASNARVRKARKKGNTAAQDIAALKSDYAYTGKNIDLAVTNNPSIKNDDALTEKYVKNFKDTKNANKLEEKLTAELNMIETRIGRYENAVYDMEELIGSCQQKIDSATDPAELEKLKKVLEETEVERDQFVSKLDAERQELYERLRILNGKDDPLIANSSLSEKQKESLQERASDLKTRLDNLDDPDKMNTYIKNDLLGDAENEQSIENGIAKLSDESPTNAPTKTK